MYMHMHAHTNTHAHTHTHAMNTNYIIRYYLPTNCSSAKVSVSILI